MVTLPSRWASKTGLPPRIPHDLNALAPYFLLIFATLSEVFIVYNYSIRHKACQEG